MSYLKIRCCHLPARISFLTEDTGKLRQIIPNASTVVSGKHSPRGRTFPVVDKSLRHLYRPRCLPCTLSVPAVSLQGFGSATTPYITDLRTALGRSGRNSQLANLYSEIADASDADYILGMLEREPGFINAVKRLRLEKQALPVLKKRVMEAADGNRSFNYENEWLRSAVDAMPPDEQEAFIGSYWTKFQRSRNRSNNDWELRERAQLLAGFGCVPAFRYAVEAAMRQDRNNYLQRLLALSACPSMEEFVVWFRDNRDNLVFDSEEGICKAAPAPSAPAQK